MCIELEQLLQFTWAVTACVDDYDMKAAKASAPPDCEDKPEASSSGCDTQDLACIHAPLLLRTPTRFEADPGVTKQQKDTHTQCNAAYGEHKLSIGD